LTSNGIAFILHDGYKMDKFMKKMMPINSRYYSDLKSCIDGIITHGLLMSTATTLNELSQDLHTIKKQTDELY